MTIKIVALCGSLRAKSTNRVLLEAAQQLVPEGLSIAEIVDGSVAEHFNADLEAAGTLPAGAAEWREKIAAADGMLVSTPEYAAGIPGAFKNALDWLVGDGRFYRKPVGIFAASSRSLGAQDALRLVLSTMSAEVVERGCVCLSLLGQEVTVEDLCSKPHLSGPIVAALEALREQIRAR